MQSRLHGWFSLGGRGNIDVCRTPSGFLQADMLERLTEFRSEQSDSDAHCQSVGEPTFEKPMGATGMDTSETVCECNGLGLGSTP